MLNPQTGVQSSVDQELTPTNQTIVNSSRLARETHQTGPCYPCRSTSSGGWRALTHQPSRLFTWWRGNARYFNWATAAQAGCVCFMFLHSCLPTLAIKFQESAASCITSENDLLDCVSTQTLARIQAPSLTPKLGINHHPRHPHRRQSPQDPPSSRSNIPELRLHLFKHDRQASTPIAFVG